MPKRERKELSEYSVEQVSLVFGKGTKKTGGAEGGHFWSIYAKEKRAGKAYVNLIKKKPIGEHAALSVFINKTHQGKHIGRHAFSKAAEQSSYNILYAYMRKSNKASIKAATHAGFKECDDIPSRQHVMKWKRRKKNGPKS